VNADLVRHGHQTQKTGEGICRCELRLLKRMAPPQELENLVPPVERRSIIHKNKTVVGISATDISQHETPGAHTLSAGGLALYCDGEGSIRAAPICGSLARPWNNSLAQGLVSRRIALRHWRTTDAALACFNLYRSAPRI
jgi:hypothetical protein